MTEPITIDRFRMLADAYGGAIARWPADEHAAALRLAQEDARAAAILAEASALDAQLDAWHVPAASSALAARLSDGGTRARRSPVTRRRWWWSGVGIAATLAGALAGSAAVAMVTPAEIAINSTSFGDVAGPDS